MTNWRSVERVRCLRTADGRAKCVTVNGVYHVEDYNANTDRLILDVSGRHISVAIHDGEGRNCFRAA